MTTMASAPEPGRGRKEDGGMTRWRQARRWMAWGGAALGVAALALALAGPATAQAPVQLRFMSWYFGEDPAGPALKALFAEFEKKQPEHQGRRRAGDVGRAGAEVHGGHGGRPGTRHLHGHPAQRPQPDRAGLLHEPRAPDEGGEGGHQGPLHEGRSGQLHGREGGPLLPAVLHGADGADLQRQGLPGRGPRSEPAAPDVGGAARLLEEAHQGQPVRHRALRQG